MLATPDTPSNAIKQNDLAHVMSALGPVASFAECLDLQEAARHASMAHIGTKIMRECSKYALALLGRKAAEGIRTQKARLDKSRESNTTGREENEGEKEGG